MTERNAPGVEKSAVLKLFPTFVWVTQFEPSVFRPINASIRQGRACSEAEKPRPLKSGAITRRRSPMCSAT